MQASAITSLQERKWQDAADLSERVMHFNSTDYASAYYLNAMANLHLGNLDQAEKSAREAIRLDSARRNPRTSYVLGLVLAEKRQFKQAAELLNAYLQCACQMRRTPRSCENNCAILRRSPRKPDDRPAAPHTTDSLRTVALKQLRLGLTTPSICSKS